MNTKIIDSILVKIDSIVGTLEEPKNFKHIILRCNYGDYDALLYLLGEYKCVALFIKSDNPHFQYLGYNVYIEMHDIESGKFKVIGKF